MIRSLHSQPSLAWDSGLPIEGGRLLGARTGKGSLPYSFLLPWPRCQSVSLCTQPCPLWGLGRGFQWQNWSKLSEHSPSTVPLPAIMQGVGSHAPKAKVIPASKLLFLLLPSPSPRFSEPARLWGLWEGKQWQPLLLNPPTQTTVAATTHPHRAT